MKNSSASPESTGAKLQQKIRTKSSQLEWRKPSKVSGKLMAELIKRLKNFTEVKAAYLTEVQIKGSTEGHVPLIAISAPHANEDVFEKILTSICAGISENDDLQSPFDVCRIEQLLDFEKIIDQGMARLFYSPT